MKDEPVIIDSILPASLAYSIGKEAEEKAKHRKLYGTIEGCFIDHIGYRGIDFGMRDPYLDDTFAPMPFHSKRNFKIFSAVRGLFKKKSRSSK